MSKLFLEDLDVRGKRVLVRVDFNVPFDDEGEISDDLRIRASLPTIRWLVDHGARTIVMSHRGRPKGKVVAELSLEPVALRLGELLRREVPLAPDCIGPEVKRKLQGLGDGGVLLLENLRFQKGEENNDPAFAAELASLGEIYVNDAFGTVHRAHASTEGVTHNISQRAAGYLMRKELDYLGEALKDPKRPFVAVIGGAKVSGKIHVIEALLKKVDSLLIGGGMAYTFFKAMGLEVGGSLLEDDSIAVAKRILEETREGKGNLLLPVDCIAADRFSNDADTVTVDADKIPVDRQGLDIGPRSVDLFTQVVREAKTVVWNGPMGVFEMENFSRGTFAVAEALAACTAAGGITIVGGGDSALAITQAGLGSQVSHVSTGGGASLELLEGKRLPGVEALSEV
jgi:phosphoglycerate kinase